MKTEKNTASKISTWQQRIEDEERHANRSQLHDEVEARQRAPRGRLNSPPAWLKSHQKELSEAWIHQKLRHVSSQGSHDAWRSHQPETEAPRRPKSSNNEDLRRKQSQVSVAERVKQLQHLDLSSRRSSELGTEAHGETTNNTSGLQSSQTTQARDKRRSRGQKKTPVPVSRRTSSAMADQGVTRSDSARKQHLDRSTRQTHSSNQSVGERGLHIDHKVTTSFDATEKQLEEFRRQDQYLKARYREVITKAEAELDRLREENGKKGKTLNEQASSSRITASAISTPPQILQPRQLPLDSHRWEQASNSRAHASDEITSQQKEPLAVVGKFSELDLHRPSAVAPPTHECSWRDRYMALTKEIRQLKAEMSSVSRVLETTEREVIHEDRMLGIESVTIVMHLKDKDDLVINTDLTQEEEAGSDG